MPTKTSKYKDLKPFFFEDRGYPDNLLKGLAENVPEHARRVMRGLGEVVDAMSGEGVTTMEVFVDSTDGEPIYTIHQQDGNVNFDSVSDHERVIAGPKGHTITYPVPKEGIWGRAKWFADHLYEIYNLNSTPIRGYTGVSKDSDRERELPRASFMIIPDGEEQDSGEE